MSAATTFADAVARWHDYYMLLGTAAATLLGLLFVAVSINLDVMQAGERLARHTFRHFIVTLLVALVFLVPGQTPGGVGWPLAALGAYGLVNEARLRRGARREDPTASGLTTRLRPVISAGAYALLGGVGFDAALRHGRAFDWLIYATLGLLTTAAIGSWRLLVVLGMRRHAARSPVDAADSAIAEPGNR